MTFNENLIREAAYFNWQNAGCPMGQDEYFWNMAIEQIYGKKALSMGCNASSTKKTSSSKKSSSSKAKTTKAKK